MRKLAGLVIICTLVMGNSPLAQDQLVVVAKPRYSAADMRMRVSGIIPFTCVLSDKREFLVDTSVAVGGKTYRCVTVLDENLKPAGAAWTPVE